MDERMFLHDVDDDQVMVAALEAHFIVLQSEMCSLRQNMRDLEDSPRESAAYGVNLRMIHMRTETMRGQIHYVIDECQRRRLWLRDRRNRLADVQVNEEPLELDPSPE